MSRRLVAVLAFACLGAAAIAMMCLCLIVFAFVTSESATPRPTPRPTAEPRVSTATPEIVATVAATEEATSIPERHVIRSLSDFESSQFCLVYRCVRSDSWDLRRGGVSNSYDIHTSPDVGLGVTTLDGVPTEYGLIFFERHRLTGQDLQLLYSFLTAIYPGTEVDSSTIDLMVDFIQQNAESDVWQICEAQSVGFGSMRIWAGKIMQQTVHVGADCHRE